MISNKAIRIIRVNAKGLLKIDGSGGPAAQTGWAVIINNEASMPGMYFVFYA